MAGDFHKKGLRRLRLPPFLGLSLLIHQLLVMSVGLVIALRGCDAPGDNLADQEVSLSTVDGSTLAGAELPAEPTELPAEESPKVERAKREIEDPKTNGQVVELPPPALEERPDHARFLAEHDSTVAHETRARASTGSTDGGAPPPPAAASAGSASSATAANPSPAHGARHPPHAATGTAQGAAAGMHLAMRDPDENGDATAGDEEEGTAGGGQPGRGDATATQRSLPSLSQLRPTDAALGRAVGVPVSDHLADLDDGDETSLNAKRWKFATFFNRVKRSVRDHWHPDVAYRRRDPTGAVYGYKDRLTVVRVELDAAGSLKDVSLEKASGLDFLDDEAVDAFRQAQPFLNPPRQLIDGESGLISFRFGFLFEVTGTSAPKVFRYND